MANATLYRDEIKQAWNEIHDMLPQPGETMEQWRARFDGHHFTDLVDEFGELKWNRGYYDGAGKMWYDIG